MSTTNDVDKRIIPFAGAGLQPAPKLSFCWSRFATCSGTIWCWTRFATPSETFFSRSGAGRGLQPRPKRFFPVRFFLNQGKMTKQVANLLQQRNQGKMTEQVANLLQQRK